MDNNNLNILVEAKKEYTEQLYMILCPLMIQTFLDLYAEANKMSKGKNVLKQYQILLKEVPNWNNHIVKQHTGKLVDSCSWFSDLLAAVFVSNVKILSSVRLNTENKKISIKLPSNEVFVHCCYVTVAKELYKDPYIFNEEHSDNNRNEILDKRCRVCLESTVKDMIPIQQILQTYISQGETMEDKKIEFNNQEPEDTEDPDVNDAPETEEEEETVTPIEEEEELKNIDFNEQPQLQPETKDDDDVVLFPGAPEQKQNS